MRVGTRTGADTAGITVIEFGVCVCVCVFVCYLHAGSGCSITDGCVRNVGIYSGADILSPCEKILLNW